MGRVSTSTSKNALAVVPEQEAFGHLHNVIYDQYAYLAETPHGSVLASGNPATLPLIKQWFTELAAMTPGPAYQADE
jgi:hexosaminidase